MRGGWKDRVGAIGCALLCGAITHGASANETLSELPTGGLAFLRPSNPAALVREAQDVRLSPDAVTITYRISNSSDAPLDVMLGFKLPELDFSDPDASYAIPGPDPLNFLSATLKVDGKPAVLPLVQTATSSGKDVSEALRRARLALVPVGTFQTDLAAMAPDMRDALLKQELIKEVGTDIEGKPLYFPTWTVRTEGLRKLTIAPRKPTEVSIRYLPSVGVTRDTVLRKALRDQASVASQVRAAKAAYCIDQGFLNGLDILSGGADANTASLIERRIRVVLAAEGEVPQPVQAYHLVVDKGRPQRIVSFCSENLKKVSATTFETKGTDLTPRAGFDLLMIDRGEPNSK